MTRILGVITSLIALALGHPHPSQASNILSPQQFTQAYVDFAKKAEPGLAITLFQPLKIEIAKDGHSITGNLDNIYELYKAQPHAPDYLEHLFQRHLETAQNLIKAKANPAPIQTSRILPILRNAQGVKSLPNSEGLLQEDYNGELAIFYVYDSPTGMEWLNKETLKELNVSFEHIKKMAFDNLKTSALPPIEIVTEKLGTYFLANGGNYEASIPLTDYIPTTFKEKVDGDIIIAVPTRDVVLVTGSNNAAGIAAMQQFVSQKLPPLHLRQIIHL